MLSPDDLATMAYAPADLAAAGDLRRKQRQRAREALNRIALLADALVLPAIRSGVRGCVQVLPPASHKAAHDSKATLWRHVRKST